MPDTPPKSTYSREEVRRLLAVTERQLKGWERDDLIRPAQTFALPDLIALQTLIKLRKSNIRQATIRLAIAKIRETLDGVEDPLRELKVYAEGRKIRVDIEGQPMEPISGQLLLNFDEAELRRLLSFPAEKPNPAAEKTKRDAAEQWFQKGLQLEHGGSIKDAIQAYETAVQIDPRSAGALVNLGTIYFNARQLSRAEAYYRKALDADPNYALAHFNMGNLYDERSQYDYAIKHYQRAVELTPGYADAHYNLALLYQGLGKTMEAVRHWKVYLKLDPASSWSAIARRELDKLRRSAVVSGSGPRPTGTRRSLD